MSTASRVYDHIQTLPLHSFTAASDMPGLSDSRVAATAAFRRAVAAGEILRVHRGLYWKGVQTRYGMTGPHTLDVGIEVARRAGFTSGVGPAGWTASNILHLSTQIPTLTHIAIPGRRVPTAPEFVQFHARAEGGRDGLAFMDVAVLEVLRAWPHMVEASWSQVIRTTRRLAAAGDIDLQRILRAAVTQPDDAVRQRAESLAAA